jgi:hypothetical protein
MRFKTDVLSQRVRRARSFTGRKTRYVLGAGGGDPNAPFPEGGASDCTGYISKALFLRRDQRKKWGLWIESTEITRDAKCKKRLFVAIPSPVSGCVMAYPDSFIKRLGRWFKQGEGHAAIVVDFTLDASGRVEALSAIDCSSGSYRRHGDAIREHDMTWMARRRDVVFMVLVQDVIV